jgi:hypothetical protein
MRMGARYGVLTAVLNILKVAVPILAQRLWHPADSLYLVSVARSGRACLAALPSLQRRARRDSHLGWAPGH